MLMAALFYVQPTSLQEPDYISPPQGEVLSKQINSVFLLTYATISFDCLWPKNNDIGETYLQERKRTDRWD